MVDKIDKMDCSFVAENKSWFKSKLGGIDVESINGITFKDLFGDPIFSWSNDSITTAMNSIGFDTFDRGASVEVPIDGMTKPNKNKTSYSKDAIISNLNNNLFVVDNKITTENADVVVNGHSLSETAKKVDGLDIVTNDMRSEIKNLETRLGILERRVHDAECSRMDIKSLIDNSCKEMFAGVSYDETNKKIEFWNYNRESLGGIVLR